MENALQSIEAAAAEVKAEERAHVAHVRKFLDDPHVKNSIGTIEASRRATQHDALVQKEIRPYVAAMQKTTAAGDDVVQSLLWRLTCMCNVPGNLREAIRQVKEISAETILTWGRRESQWRPFALCQLSKLKQAGNFEKEFRRIKSEIASRIECLNDAAQIKKMLAARNNPPLQRKSREEPPLTTTIIGGDPRLPIGR
jgi:hypothetical protein